jgi:hypothetical protein
MAKVTVYDKEGKPHEVDSVDAKEYVASGSYTAENPNPEVKHEADPAADEAVREARDAASTVTPTKASRKK